MSANLITLFGGFLILVGTAIAYWGVYLTNEQSGQKTDQILAKNEMIAELSQKNADLSEQLRAYATGGDSYVWLKIADFGTGQAIAALEHEGKHPVRNIAIEIFDVTENIPAILAGSAKTFGIDKVQSVSRGVAAAFPHGSRKLSLYPFEANPTAERYAYFILIYAENGQHRELVQFEKVNGQWKQAYRVQEIADDGSKRTKHDHLDEGFPPDNNVVVRL